MFEQLRDLLKIEVLGDRGSEDLKAFFHGPARRSIEWTRGPGSETAVHLFMRHPHGDSKIWQEDFMTDFKSPFFLFVLLPIISSKIDYIESPLRVSYRLKRDHPLIIKALQYFLKSYGFAPDMASELVTMPDKRTLITEIVKADPRQFKESKTFLAFCAKLDALGRRQSFELESPHSK